MTITDTPPAAPARDRVPNDRVAEMTTLGSMILSKNAIGDITEIVAAHDFYQPKHVAIYKAIINLYADGQPVDGVTLTAHLADTGQTATIGADYIQELLAAVPTAANGVYYARIVREKAVRRRLIEASTRIIQIAESDITDPDAPVADRAGQIMHEAVTDRAYTDTPPIGDYIDTILDDIEAGQQHGLSTGLADLDDLTFGLQPGTVWIVAGRPAMGKSVVLVDFARAVALRQELPVQFFSLEMTRKALTQRMLAAETKIELHRIKAGGRHLDEQQWARLHDAAADIKRAPLYIDERAKLTITDIAAATRRMAQRQPLGLVVVDYLQLMQGIGGAGEQSREREIANISRGLKVLAKDLGVPIVAAAQLNRGPEQRTEKRPQLSDLRESGSLEQDADVVMLLHRPDYYDKESPRAGEADFIVAKNREGPTDTITVCSQLEFSRFASYQYVK